MTNSPPKTSLQVEQQVAKELVAFANLLLAKFGKRKFIPQLNNFLQGDITYFQHKDFTIEGSSHNRAMNIYDRKGDVVFCTTEVGKVSFAAAKEKLLSVWQSFWSMSLTTLGEAHG